MSPDPPPVSKRALPESIKETNPSAMSQSRVQSLLGVPNGGAVSLVSAVSLPRIDLPYVNTQRGETVNASTFWEDELRAEADWESIADESRAEVEPTSSDHKFPLPPQDRSVFSSSLQQTSLDGQEPTDAYLPDVKQGQGSVETMSTEPVLSSSDVSLTPSKTSISIPGITSAPTSNPLPATRTASLRVEDRNPDEQPTMPHRQATASSSEEKATTFAVGFTEDTQLDPQSSPSKSVETQRSAKQEEKLLDTIRPSLGNQEISTVDGITHIRSGNQPSLSHTSVAPELNPISQPINQTVDNNVYARQLNDRTPIATQRSNFGSTSESESEAITTADIQATLGFNAHSSKVHPTTQISGVQKSVVSGLSPVVGITPESVAIPMPEPMQGQAAAENRYPVTRNLPAQIEKLERAIADLSSQVATQKDFQPSVVPSFPQPSPPQNINQRSTSQPKAPRAFWERSYVSRLYRWSRR